MISRLILPLLVIVWASQAAAQQRAVVVPAEASVIVPARGAAPVAEPGPSRRARRVVSNRMLMAARPAETGATSLLVTVPLGIAAGVLAATLGSGGGSGGGVSAPARTR